MKIDQEDFNRKAQHIIDTVVKPQVEKYERAKAIEVAAANLADPNVDKTENWIAGAKWMQEQQLNTSTVTRVEVIQHSEPFNGRAYTNYRAKDVEIQFQDDGRTLKIFLK
jgi:hypothetical protein